MIVIVVLSVDGCGCDGTGVDWCDGNGDDVMVFGIGCICKYVD